MSTGSHPSKSVTISDLGSAPIDWRVVDLASLTGNTKANFDDGDWIEAKDMATRGVRLVQTGNIGSGQFIEKGGRRFVSESTFQELNCKPIEPGDLLICRLADPAGRACLLPVLEEEKVITSVDVTIVRPHEDEADKRFLMQLFGTPAWLGAVAERCGGSTRSRIARLPLGRIRFAIPCNVEEQRAIADALTDADALIDSLEQLLTKKRQIKQGAMQELLTGTRRLPGFRENWDEATFADVALIDPENLGSGTRADFAFNYIALEGVDQGRLISFAETQFDGSPSRARRVLREGDVLVATVRPNLKSHLLFDSPQGHWIASTGFSVVRCKAGTACPGFLFALMFSSIVERQIDALLTGSNYPAINGRDVANLTFARPPFDEQVAIAEVLSDMDTEIAALESRLTKARVLKQAMAQALLTGRIRLVEPIA